jgi:hypothetical protein
VFDGVGTHDEFGWRAGELFNAISAGTLTVMTG